MRLCPGRPGLVKNVATAGEILAIALNTIACAYGAWCWWRARASVWFWRVTRAAQAAIVLQAALNGILVLTGPKPKGLHILYSVVPLLVSLIAESLRVAAAQTVLDHRGLENAQAVGRLPEDRQRGIVIAIIQRELAVMTIAAAVVVVLLLRAAQTG
jgi:hypothetical protein